MGTNIDYSTVSHETIYQRITGGAGSTGLLNASASWQEIAAKRENRTMPTPIKVPEVSFSQDPLMYIGQHAVEWMAGIQTEHERAKVAAQQAEQRACELMTSYQSASNDNLAISQSFTLAPRVVADVSDPSPGGAGVGGGGAAHGTLYSGVASAAAAPSAPGVAEHAANGAPMGTAPQVASEIDRRQPQPPRPSWLATTPVRSVTR